MAKLVKNCSHVIDWPSVIESIELLGNSYVKKGRPEQWMETAVLDKDSIKPWQSYIDKLDSAKFNFGSTCWHSFVVGKHYNNSIDEKLCNFFNISKLDGTVINRVDPGCVCPLHIDNVGNMKPDDENRIRYFIQISKPEYGQVFTVGHEYLSFKEAGDTYLWDHYHDWHGAANFGFHPVYYFSIFGFK